MTPPRRLNGAPDTMAQEESPTNDAASKTQETPKEAPAEAPAKVRRCRCGYARGHHMVSAEGQYTFSGYLRLFFGISARPTRVKYHCRRCDKVFDATTDPAILDHFY